MGIQGIGSRTTWRAGNSLEVARQPGNHCGVASFRGLQAMDDGADVLTTLARELVMHQGVGQSADEVWKALQVQQPEIQTPEPTALEPMPEPPLIFVPRPVPSLIFGRDAPAVAARRRFGSVPSSEQLPLF